MNAKRTRNYYDMFAIMLNFQKSYRKYIENTHLGLLTETHEYYFGSLKHQIFIYSRWRHPPKTISPRPYCRSRRGRNGLGSETRSATAPHLAYARVQQRASIIYNVKYNLAAFVIIKCYFDFCHIIRSTVLRKFAYCDRKCVT